MHPKGRFSLCLGLGLVVASTSYAAMSLDTNLAGWKPVVTLWGGEPSEAIRTLDKVTHALDATIHRYEIDEPTQKFINGVIKELEDFDLDGLYKLLPDERSGHRELNVKGALYGDRYRIGRAEPGSAYFVGMAGPRNGLADMSLFVRAQQKEGNKHDTLLLDGSAGLGVGPLSYRSLVEAQRELLRLVTSGHPAPDASQPLPISGLAREAVREMNPGLGEEDLRALALLFDAYPTLAKALTQLGRVEDVQTASQAGNYHHITTRLRGEPKRLEKKYPALAKHAKKLSDVLFAKARLLDDRGRDLVRVTLDSEKLVATIECYVRDGLLLPFDGRQVYENEPLDPLGTTLERAQVRIDARVNMLGIVVNAKNLRVDARYKAHDSYASAAVSMTTVPSLKVEGRALGLFAPGFLDLFIPSNMQDITEEFFRVAAKGHGGKGVHARGELGAQHAGAPGVIAGSAGAEIMDTFLVKFAGGLVANRLMINEKEKDEAVKLAAELHDAFVVDLTAFKKRMAGLGE
jgi:hypothetical protein